LRLAVAQSTVPEDPTDPENLRASGRQIRALMREARDAGARLVQFPEGAITYPGKRVIANRPGLAVADIDLGTPDPDIDAALRLARPWRRTARTGLYDRHVVRGDGRSETRTEF
jgi:predicted amidohydrolase